MQRIVVLNPKGGSGKTTIAINLASYYAQRGERPALMDYDPQASAARWVRKRQASQAPIYLINAFEKDNRVTRAFQLRVPDGTRRIIIDTPAAVEATDMPELVANADKILVPVLPSDIDIHACARCITSLLLVAKVKRAREPAGDHRQPRAPQYAHVPVADAFPRHARYPDRRDAPRFAEFRARRRTGARAARNEALPGQRGSAGVGVAAGVAR